MEEPGGEAKSAKPAKEEFAVVEDVKTPVANFHKRIPHMAHKVGMVEYIVMVQTVHILKI